MNVRRPTVRAAVAAITLGVAGLSWVSSGAQAVPVTDVFELDGDGTAGVAPGDDWSCLFTAPPLLVAPVPSCASNAVSSKFVPDPVQSPDDDILGQGSKDTLDVSQWSGVLQKPPPKDDLENALFATYDVDGRAVTFFGIDRYDNTGDSFWGFWFFKNRITKNADGTYNGAHAVGDILIVADNKNAHVQLSVYAWDPVTCGGTGSLPPTCGGPNLREVLARGTVDCATAGTGPICGVVNPTSNSSPWPFTPKNGPANTWEPSEFLEGRIDLTELLGTGDCFSSIQAESRSSESTTAELKDTILAEINTCGTIKITKDAVPNDAQDFAFSSPDLGPAQGPLVFNLDDDADPTLANTTTILDVRPGTHTVAEGSTAGWDLTSIVCSDPVGGNSTGNVATRTATLQVARGETVECTFTNTKKAHLKLVKAVTKDNGGTAVVTDWTLGAAGPTPLSGQSGTADVDKDVAAGAYSLSESGGPAGYAASAWSCVGGSLSADVVTLTPGQSAVCTITNDDIAPKLHLRKIVTNNSGGTATVADFTLTADGTGSNDVSGTSPVDSTATLQADTWSLSETTVNGYTPSAWSCVGGTQNGSSITVGLGGEATCTITNDDNPAHLKLVKLVTNDNGGTAVAADFTLTATGPTPLSGSAPAESDVNAGSYALSESGPSGYAASSWSCVGGTQSGSNISLALGQSATCTITNDDIAPKLHLRKVVDNANGGTATVADFTLTADGTGSNDLSGTSPVDSGVGLQADTWALSETTLTGYAASAWTCVGGSQNGTNVTVGIGGEATCTVTNTSRLARLTLVKRVTNNNGGTAVAGDFTLSAAGPTPISGAGGADSDVRAGTYALSETTLPGYTAGSWSCVGGTQSGSNITLGLGQSATCTITNDDVAPKLHLRKVVVNDNGGTLTSAAFTLTADGAGSNDLSGTTPVDSGAGLSADTWALSETNVAGYQASSWVCVGGSQTGANVTLTVGQEATCTITNNDIAPRLSLTKIVVNDHGGTAVTTDFTLAAAGPTPLSGAGGVAQQDVNVGTYTLSETASAAITAAYAAGAWQCTGGGTLTGNQIKLGLADVAACTITNDDRPGTIIIRKVSKPSGGTFNYTTTGAGFGTAGAFTLPGGTQQSFTLSAGSYSASETAQPGWMLTGIGTPGDSTTPYSCVVTGSGGSTGTGSLATGTVTIALKNGDTVTCVYENTATGGVTRTQGFWATHPELSRLAWFGGSNSDHTFPGVSDNLLCGRPIDTLDKLMSGFWSDISKTSTGAKRTALDQARMQLLQQLLAAELNYAAFGTAPAAGNIATWEAAFCGSNATTIKNAQSQAASYNTSGDSATFTPGTSANSKAARALAGNAATFWDVLPAG